MANTFSANVIKCDTSAAFTYAKNICGIKYIGETNGTATVKGGGTSSGDLLWEEEGTANVFDSNLEIRDSNGVYVTIANGAVVYLYLK